MNELEQSFTGMLYQPYFNLGPPFAEGAFHPFGIEFDYLSLTEGVQYPRIQSVLMPSYRDVLIEEAGMPHYRVQHPLQLPPELRTERWQRLCDYVEHYKDLTQLTQLQVLRLLGKLCLYQVVLELEPEELTTGIIASGEVPAQIAYMRALSHYVFHMDDDTQPYHLHEFERIATEAPGGCLARINALYQMVVQNVKHHNNLAAVEYWLPLHYQEIQQAKPELDAFTYELLMSRYHRVAGFAPQMRRDKDGVVREMESAETYARNMPRTNRFQCIAADEMLYPVLESRTKEAIWMGDMELAEARAQSLVSLCPMEPRTHLQLGQVLLDRGKIEKATLAYRAAARLGPPGTEIAHFMLGQCYEALDQLELARESYLSALRLDRLSVSAAERLSEVAQTLGDHVLARWSQSLYDDLQGEEVEEQVRAYQKMPPPVRQG